MKISDALLKKIRDRVLTLILDKGIPAEEAVKMAWKEFKVPDSLYQSVKSATIAEISKSMGKFEGDAVTTSKAWERLVNEDGIVRKQVTEASARARRDLVQEVKSVIKSGESAKQAALRIQEAGFENTGVVRKEIDKLAKYGATDKQIKALKRKIDQGIKGNDLKGSYKAVIDAVESGVEDKIAKQLDYAVIDKTRYNMERVIRTERARATAEADREVIAQSDAQFVKFVLTAGHKPDICDAYANADMGYGKGVYPIDKAPILPIHPNGKSRLVPVFVPKRSGKEIDPEEAIQNTADSMDVKAYDGIKLSAIKKRL